MDAHDTASAAVGGGPEVQGSVIVTIASALKVCLHVPADFLPNPVGANNTEVLSHRLAREANQSVMQRLAADPAFTATARDLILNC